MSDIIMVGKREAIDITWNNCEVLFLFEITIYESAGALTINNPTVLNTLKENNTLIVQGEYEVFESTDNNYSYIVIKS